MSPGRIRPGSAKAGGGSTEASPARGAAGAPGAGAPGGDTPLGGTEQEAPAGEDLASADVPVALPLEGVHSPDLAIAAADPLQTVGPQRGDEPLRPDEFVDLAAAEQVLGHEAVEAFRRGERRPSRDEIDEIDETDEDLLEQDLVREAALERATEDATTGTARHERAFSRLYHGRTRFDFVGRKASWFAISLTVIVAGLISLGVRGLDLGIDFAGGTAWQVRTAASSLSSTALVNNARSALTPFGLGGSTITILGSNHSTQTLEVQAKLGSGRGAANQSLALVHQVSDKLAALVHTNFNAVSVTQIGPSWGSSVTNKAIEALIVFFILISLYITIFFEWRMALAAVIAVAHDVLVVIGIYSLTGFQVTPDTVVAILTILGYSLYDTIVVFDRVRDNIKSTAIGASGRISISDIINLSMNQTLARSVNTSLVAILPILSVLVLGADVLGATTLQYFGWALLIGLLSGAYSSIFIASPLVAVMKEREQRWRNVRERLVQRGGDHLLLSAEAVAAGALGADGALPSPRRARREAARAAVTSSNASPGTPASRGAGGGRITPGTARAGGQGSAGSRGNGAAAVGAASPAGRPPARKARKGRQR